MKISPHATPAHATAALAVGLIARRPPRWPRVIQRQAIQRRACGLGSPVPGDPGSASATAGLAGLPGRGSLTGLTGLLGTGQADQG
jgi:hypothetical protein